MSPTTTDDGTEEHQPSQKLLDLLSGEIEPDTRLSAAPPGLGSGS
jgi:hypothetical protein